MSRRRGIVRLPEEDIWRLLALGPHERVTGVFTDPVTNEILIRIEGPDLPEVVEGGYLPNVHRPFALAQLRLDLLTLWGERGPGRRLQGKPEEFADEVEVLIRKAVLPDA